MQTLVQSLLRLLEQLPRGPASAQQAQQAQLQPLRRTASMQALSVCDPGSPLGSAAGVRRQGSHASLPRPPSLPAVSEHQPQHSGLAHAESAPVLPAVQEQGEQRAAGRRPPRRSQSETALAQLAQQQRLGRLSRPLWLAELLRPQRPPEGWGLCSAASLQELACRQLCASLVQRYCQQQGGGRRLPPGLVAAVEAELRWAFECLLVLLVEWAGWLAAAASPGCSRRHEAWQAHPPNPAPLAQRALACAPIPPHACSAHLPEEVAACIARELRLLAEPPAPTKLSLHQLAVAAEAATASKATGAPPAEGLPPSWAYPFLQGGGHGGAAALQWQATEVGAAVNVLCCRPQCAAACPPPFRARPLPQCTHPLLLPPPLAPARPTCAARAAAPAARCCRSTHGSTPRTTCFCRPWSGARGAAAACACAGGGAWTGRTPWWRSSRPERSCCWPGRGCALWARCWPEAAGCSGMK